MVGESLPIEETANTDMEIIFPMAVWFVSEKLNPQLKGQSTNIDGYISRNI